MSMYRFVKDTHGSGANKRLFVQATLENEPEASSRPSTTSRPLKSSLKKTGPPITTSLNEDALPRFRVHEDGYNGRIVHDGEQTHFEYDESMAVAKPRSSDYHYYPGDDSLMAIYTKKRLSTEVLGSSLESTKVSRKSENGARRITTRIVRKVTTLSRGEEKSSPHELMRRASGRQIAETSEYARNAEMRAIQPKRVKVLLKRR